jgi:cephalosporin hydroxylase
MPIAKEKITFLLGSSTDPKVVAEVHRRAKGKRVLVLLDSLHSKAHVAGELAAYAPLVTRGSYIIVQDTPVGPIGAIEDFMANNDKFIIDRKRERYPDMNSIKGFLRRVKN